MEPSQETISGPLSSSDSYAQGTPATTSTITLIDARAFMFGSIVSLCSDTEFDDLDNGIGRDLAALRVDSGLSLDEIAVNESPPTPIQRPAAPQPPSPYARRAIHATSGDWRQLCARLGLPARLAGGVADVEVTPRVLSIAT